VSFVSRVEAVVTTIKAAPPVEPCICPRFTDTGGFRIADLTCPVHGVGGTSPGDGYWSDDEKVEP
jgi:hypothetical protein